MNMDTRKNIAAYSQLWESHEIRNLHEELDAISKGMKYHPISESCTEAATTAESAAELRAQFSDSTGIILLKKPLYPGLEWIRNQSSYQDQYGNRDTIRTICKVVGMQSVTVKAGTFAAFFVDN